MYTCTGMVIYFRLQSHFNIFAYTNKPFMPFHIITKLFWLNISDCLNISSIGKLKW